MSKTKWIRSIDNSLNKVKSDQWRMDLFIDFLSIGYFPYQLPPPFNSTCLKDLLSNNIDIFFTHIKNELINKYGVKRAKPTIYNLARPGQLRRVLHIVPPLHYALLCLEICAYWDELQEMAKGNNKSLTFPKITRNTKDDPSRALENNHNWSELPLKKLAERSHAKYVIKADISRFFPSIYTHSIPWATEGKNSAKSNTKGWNSLGNRIDTYIRTAQDGQTLGIPIGPDSSSLISEIILAKIDLKIDHLFIGSVRFVDDYELYTKNSHEAELGLTALQEQLKEYELELNTLKTSVSILPTPLDQIELKELRSFDFGEELTHRTLLTFFEIAFNIYSKNKKAGILKYALRKFEQNDNNENNITLEGRELDYLIDFMCQCMMIEEGTIEFVLRIISQYGQGTVEEKKEKIIKCLEHVLEEHIKLKHSSEVAWALWGYIILNSIVPTNLAKGIIQTGDAISTILLLDIHSRGLVKGIINKKSIFSNLSVDSLFSSDWMLAYESIVKGWATSGKKSYINKSDTFNYLKKNDVSFYSSPEQEDKILMLMANWNPTSGYDDIDEDEDCIDF